MLLSSKKNIEDLVIQILTKSQELTGPELMKKIIIFRPKTTKQALYSALRFLQKEEIVTKRKNYFFISRIWIQKIQQLLNQQSVLSEPIFNLTDGQSISYSFPNFLMCDMYWAHLFDILAEWVPQDQPVFMWNPHEWLTLGRAKTEAYVFSLFKKEKKKAYFSIQGREPLDLLFKKKYKNNFVEINIGNTLSLPSTYYVNIFKNYIIEVFITKELAETIERYYKENITITKSSFEFFKKITKEKHKIKMKISKNKKKADKLRKQLSKDFALI